MIFAHNLGNFGNRTKTDDSGGDLFHSILVLHPSHELFYLQIWFVLSDPISRWPIFCIIRLWIVGSDQKKEAYVNVTTNQERSNQANKLTKEKFEEIRCHKNDLNNSIQEPDSYDKFSSRLWWD